MEKNIWLDGMMGVIVGDALGCPVQFMSRNEIKNRPTGPVCGMESGGVYRMPEGTWTDDSSMALATLSSILKKGKADPADIMMQFVNWEMKGEYTPFGKAFDQGNTCLSAIYRFVKNPDIKVCGSTGEYANGNGALMRIMPACLYYYEKQKKVCTSDDEAIEAIHVITGLTHNHLRSKMCCGIYYFCVKSILDGMSNYWRRKEHWESLNDKKSGDSPHKPALGTLLQAGVDAGLKYYGRDLRNLTEMAYLGRLFDLSEFQDVAEEKIKSTGYVIDTIEAVFWSLLNTDSFEKCLLKAVNLGDDTDTVGAIAGGLAGLYYGYEAIPAEWLSVIKRRGWIEDLCQKMTCEEKRAEKIELDIHMADVAEINIPITDIHMHCLYDVDDGAQTPEMAMEMIRSSYAQGVRNIFCTSHDLAYEDDPKVVTDVYDGLRRKCASELPDMNLYLGCEIYVEPELMIEIVANLQSGKYPTMNGTRYVLIEFPTGGISFDQAKTCVKTIMEAGYIPILAHCERYVHIFNGIKDIASLKDMGCLIQINAYSIAEETDVKIKTLANEMLDAKLADFLGTDAHRMTHRPPKVIAGVKALYKRVARDYADAICYKNVVEYLKINN